MHCRCGKAKVLAHGMCAVCYTLKRQDEEHFGGLREKVLERDGYRCRVCDASGRDKRSIIVHHRVPGKSVLALMISLCPACHAKIHRTRVVVRMMPPLLSGAMERATSQGARANRLELLAGPSTCESRGSVRCEVASLWWQRDVQTLSCCDDGAEGSHLPRQAEVSLSTLSASQDEETQEK